MGKAKTSKRQEKSSANIALKSSKYEIKSNKGVSTFNPLKDLLNEKLVAQGIWECLKDGDHEALIEIIGAHLNALNISEIRGKANIPHSTLYSFMKSKNPTIKTLCKLIHAMYM